MSASGPTILLRCRAPDRRSGRSGYFVTPHPAALHRAKPQSRTRKAGMTIAATRPSYFRRYPSFDCPQELISCICPLAGQRYVRVSRPSPGLASTQPCKQHGRQTRTTAKIPRRGYRKRKRTCGQASEADIGITPSRPSTLFPHTPALHDRRHRGPARRTRCRTRCASLSTTRHSPRRCTGMSRPRTRSCRAGAGAR